ncbi:MAG: helical backbone metal receptor [Endomicrobium sp.]|jgi:iron complex transport system substrate-binding protein|nr:helical backbone metal receptor [Endomicrobium sp.]
MKIYNNITAALKSLSRNLFFTRRRFCVRKLCVYIFAISALFLFPDGSFAKDYKRIVSLAPSITQSLYDLGIDLEIAAITVYCPKGNAPKENIGTLLEPDLEKIASLRPDLIISTKDGNNKAAVEKLKRMGFYVYVVDTAANFAEICSNFYNLAQVVGKSKKAGEIVAAATTEIENVFNKIQNNNYDRVFWEVGAKPLYSAGSLSFVNDYNRFTKTENIYKDVKMRYPPVDIEDVSARNPDIIILVNMGDITSSQKDFWKKYKNINAVKNGRIYMTDANDIFTPTPLTFAKGVKILAEILWDIK